MNTRRTNVLYPFQQARDEVDRLFNEFVGRLPTLQGGRFNLAAPTFPAVNVWQSDNEVFAEAEVPGVKAEELDISVVGNELTIKGTRQQVTDEKAAYHRRERGAGAFARVVRLPMDVDAEKVQASLRDGVLTLTLPKAEAAKPRRINVAS
jgi:HSP20 family protein